VPVTGYGHMGMTVADLERSLAFYTQLLGFRVVATWTRDEQYIRDLLGYPDLTLRAAVLEIPGSDELLELVQYDDVARSPVVATHADPGTCHLSLLVTELDELVEDLRAAGVELVAPPVTPTVGPNRGGRAVYLIDPDGIRVELTQTSKRLDGAAVV
jgi:lactoylglutathione lyase